MGHELVEVLERGLGEFVHRGWQNLDLLPDPGETAPGQPYVQPVDRLEGVQTTSRECLIASELPEDFGEFAGSFSGREVRHRTTGLRRCGAGPCRVALYSPGSAAAIP